MTARNYLILCLLIVLAVALVILYVPGLSEAIERWLLGFLARNAAV